MLTGKDDERKAVTALESFAALANEAIIAAEPTLVARYPSSYDL